MKGYLINLKKRHDRLKRFQENVQNHLPDFQIEVIEATDGSLLNLTDQELKKNINPWNFKFLNEKTLRGVIGCCLSHLECYKKIIVSSEQYAIIFEDDCYFIHGQESKSNDTIKNLKLPDKFGIVWLNKWDCKIDDKINGSIDDKLKLIIDSCKTTESYIVSKEFAKILYEENIKNIGAIDAHIGKISKKYPEYPCYTISEEIFTQFNRKDSNIR